MNQFLLAIAENTRTTIFQHHHHHYRDHHHLHPFNPTHNCHRPLPWRGPEQPGGRTLHLLGCRLAGLIKRNPTSSFKSRKKQFHTYLLFQKHSFRNGTLWARTLWTATLAAAWTLREYFLFKKNAINAVYTFMNTNNKRNIHGSLPFCCMTLHISSPLFLVVFLRLDLPANLNLFHLVFVVYCSGCPESSGTSTGCYSAGIPLFSNKMNNLTQPKKSFLY